MTDTMVSPTPASTLPAEVPVATTKSAPLTSPRIHLLLAALSGFLYYVAFPGIDFWPAAFFVFTPWLVGLRGRTPKQALLGGLVLGLVCGLFGFYWLLEMLKTFSGFGTPLCFVFMTILCAYQAGRFSLMGWLYVRGADRGFSRGLLLSLAFAASETLYPMLFPFTFATTVHQVYPLIQIAEIGGPFFVALTLLAPSYLLYLFLEATLEARRAGSKPSFGALFRAVGPRRALILFAIPLVSALYGLVRIKMVDQTIAQAEKVKVGIVQANMGLAEKRTDIHEGKRRHIDATRKLRVEDKVDLVVWSETSVAGGVDESDVHNVYGKLAKSLKVPTIMGAVLRKRVKDARRYVLYNTALLGNPDGKLSGRYDKQFLLAFGEYLPFGEMFPILYEWSPNSGHFTPGTRMDPVRLGSHEISVFICYEDILPAFVNQLMHRANPELLVNMTNDAWFGDTTEPWEHMALSTLRAVEQRRFFVRSTNSGISGFVDPVGRILKKTETFEQAAISEELRYLDGSTIFRYLGTTPAWFATFGALALAFWRGRKSDAKA